MRSKSSADPGADPHWHLKTSKGRIEQIFGALQKHEAFCSRSPRA
jgi:hypothetical protein